MNASGQEWDPGDRAYPYWDDQISSMVVKHVGEGLMVSVSPMLFNDRVLLSTRDGYPREWVAGFCYPKGPAAGLAALAWDPVTEPRPAGYMRVAGDGRYPHLPDEGEHSNEAVGPRHTTHGEAS